jgi:hypothetical protein
LNVDTKPRLAGADADACADRRWIVEFFRSYPQTRETLCAEVVAAWLRSRGVAVPYERGQMLRMWRRGVGAGAAIAARRLGFSRVEEPRSGDVVLLMQADGSEILGACAGDVCVAAGGGAVAITTDAPLAAWRRA